MTAGMQIIMVRLLLAACIQRSVFPLALNHGLQTAHILDVAILSSAHADDV